MGLSPLIAFDSHILIVVIVKMKRLMKTLKVVTGINLPQEKPV